MEYLEKTQGWKEEEFDVVLQFMRTVLLRRESTVKPLLETSSLSAADGASLIYTTPSVSSQLPTLIHSSLGIHSLLKKQPLKHNVIDRDKVVIPPNWDSWGKIRVLRDGFDVDLVSNGWSIDLDQPFPRPEPNGTDAENGQVNGDSERAAADPEGSTVVLYEDSVQDPSMDALQLAGRDTHSTKLEVETIDTQTFLGQQLKVLDAFKQKNDEAARDESRHKPHKKLDDEHLVDPDRQTDARVLEHIGPVQFNMGGIQVDADDMVQRLKVRLFLPSPPPTQMLILCLFLQERQAFGTSPEPGSPTAEEGMESTSHMDTENLQAFFHGLMNRRGASAK
jgi:dynein light intermediate chain 1